jgi:signal transduction histidine kinase
VRPRLRTLLLLINLMVLALPLAGVFVLRVYESALIRQTESELIAQAAVIEAIYEGAFERLTDPREAGTVSVPADYGLPLRYRAPPTPGGNRRFRSAQLDLAGDTIYPPPPDPEATPDLPDSLARNIGRELTPVLRRAQLYTLAGIRIVDPNGIVVASTSEDIGDRLPDRAEVLRALEGEPVSMLRRRGSEEDTLLSAINRGSHIFVVVAQPIVRGQRVLGAVVLLRTPANIEQVLWVKRRALLRGALMLLAAVLALSLFTSLTISRPVHALIEQARRAARGERGAVTPLARSVTREIHELSQTLAAMAATLESRNAYIRDFAAHVSHEFKTPLTSLQGAVELLREHGADMSPAERDRFLEMLGADAARLERLVRRLLDLARADVTKPARETCRLDEVLNALVARYRELGPEIELDAAFARAAAGATVAAAGDVIDSILGTLCENARQHAGEHVRMRIGGIIDGAARRVRITVADSGPGIPPADAMRIFEPFFTTARERGGTGLGLAIARSLLAGHGGTIELLPAPMGACFAIELPLSRIERILA